MTVDALARFYKPLMALYILYFIVITTDQA
jgi:hypothetical protein